METVSSELEHDVNSESTELGETWHNNSTANKSA